MKRMIGCYAVRAESHTYLVVTEEDRLVFYIFPELFSRHKKVSSRSMKKLLRTKYKWLRYGLNDMEEPVNMETVLKDPRLNVLNYYRLNFEF